MKPAAIPPRLSYTGVVDYSPEGMPGMSSRILLIPAAGLALTLAISQSSAQTGAQKAAPAKRETNAKGLSAKELKKKEAALRKELETPWKKWLDEDVTFIISDEEKKAFKALNTDEEREQFVEQFWLRRDPTPDTDENEFKEEHYRRIAYANEHFASGIPGWRTDRGRTYIQWGPPDEIEAHSSGGSYNRPMSEGGGETQTFPFEQWRYRYLDGIGQNIILEFVDTSMSGEYRLTMDPSEKDALLHVPNAGLTLYEQQGLSTKTDRFNRSDGTRLGVPEQYMNQSMNEFTRMETYFKVQQPPPVKFKDLEAESITSRITYNRLPMDLDIHYVRVTDASVMANITMLFQNSDLQFTQKDGVERAAINVFGNVTTMMHRRVTKFEPTLETTAPPSMLQAYAKNKQIHQESLNLAPGRYRLNIVAKDVMSGNVAITEQAIDVPYFPQDKLAASSLIIADQIEPLATRKIGAGDFAIGATKVRPRVGKVPKFNSDETMGFYVQFYNFAIDPNEKASKPNGEIEYSISKVGADKPTYDFTDDLSTVPNASAYQATFEKRLPLSKLGPGTYTLKVKATDRRANQSVQQQSDFTVN